MPDVWRTARVVSAATQASEKKARIRANRGGLRRIDVWQGMSNLDDAPKIEIRLCPDDILVRTYRLA